MSGTSGADLAQQRQRERERADEDPEHRLLQIVAVPQPHEPRRERLCRHLHDQDAEGHDEPRQPDHRTDDRAQDRARGRLRVGPRRSADRPAPRSRRELGQQRPGQGARERDHPQAALQSLAPLEACGPRPPRDRRLRARRRHDRSFAPSSCRGITRLRRCRDGSPRGAWRDGACERLDRAVLERVPAVAERDDARQRAPPDRRRQRGLSAAPRPPHRRAAPPAGMGARRGRPALHRARMA